MTARAADADTTHSLSARAKTLTEDVRTNTRHATRPDTQRRTCGAVACARHDRTHVRKSYTSVISHGLSSPLHLPPSRARDTTRFYLLFRFTRAEVGAEVCPPTPRPAGMLQRTNQNSNPPNRNKPKRAKTDPNADRGRFLFRWSGQW